MTPLSIHMKANHQKLLKRAALISSPLLALLSVAPMSWYMGSIEKETLPFDIPVPVKHMLVFFIISLMVYGIWRVNIALRNHYASEADFSDLHGRKRMLLFSYLIVIAAVISITIARGYSNPRDLGAFKYYPLGAMMVTNFIIILMINFIDSTQENTQLRLEKSDLEVSNLIAAHEQLKQQIQPHFLFNALSNLQILIGKSPQDAATYVEVLSNFLRNSVHLNAKDSVLLQEDLLVLHDYITLQQLRFESSIYLDVDIPEHILSKRRLPVFCLQLLGENAIKHNMFTAEAPLMIRIRYDEDQDRLNIQNNRAQKYRAEEEKSGTGLVNLKKRFELETKDKIEIRSDDASYNVSLPLLG